MFPHHHWEGQPPARDVASRSRYGIQIELIERVGLRILICSVYKFGQIRSRSIAPALAGITSPLDIDPELLPSGTLCVPI